MGEAVGGERIQAGSEHAEAHIDRDGEDATGGR